MFLIDISSSMGNLRTVELEDSKGKTQTTEMTHLEWSLQYVKLKIQEMVRSFGSADFRLLTFPQIFNGRKTDQCGVIIFGSEGIYKHGLLSFTPLNPMLETKNIINAANGGYENVSEYIPIAQPNHGTIAKIDALSASTTTGDRMDFI